LNKQTVIYKDLGTIDYKEAWDYQEQLLQENVQVKIHNRVLTTDNGRPTNEDQFSTLNPQLQTTTHYLLLCEHPPVYTIGKSGDIHNILISEEKLHEGGMQFFQTNRGGDITFHGLQQIVGYPILDLEKIYTDIGKYLRALEEIIILTLSDYGIKGERSKGETGVWIEPGIVGKERKICAMGVRCSRWITMHGFALNVNNDLDYFNNIIPCGIPDKQVTSIKKELNKEVNLDEVKTKIKHYFEQVFNVELKN
jgi:lipoyl(octanoyl) transferase